MRNFIGTKRILPAALAVGALLIVALLAAPLLAAHHGRGSASPAHPSASPTTEPTPSPPGTVSLVHGTRAADGIELGYPYSTAGAVSAAADWIGAIASALDPDYAASLGRAVADPAATGLPSNLASSVVKLRAALRLPTTGPLPPPVAFLTTAQMYQVRDATPNNVLVLLLTTNTFINAQGGSAQTTGVYPLRMHWTGGDWRLAAIGGTATDYSPLNAAPGSPDAAAKGWQALTASPGGTP